MLRKRYEPVDLAYLHGRNAGPRIKLSRKVPFSTGWINFEQVVLDGSDMYWIERRPLEGGCCVIVRRRADGEMADMLPPSYSARTTVHEYGGGSLAVSDGTIYFSNFSDQRVYRLIPGSTPEPVVFAGSMRYADHTIDSRRNRIICVREDHTFSDHDPANTLVHGRLNSSVVKWSRVCPDRST